MQRLHFLNKFWLKDSIYTNENITIKFLKLYLKSWTKWANLQNSKKIKARVFCIFSEAWQYTSIYLAIQSYTKWKAQLSWNILSLICKTLHLDLYLNK